EASGVLEWLVEHEHRLARDVASPRPHVDGPGRLFLAIHSKLYRTRYVILALLIEESALQRSFGRIHVGRHLRKLQPLRFLLPIKWSGGDHELGDRERPVGRPPWSLQRQIGMFQRLESQSCDPRLFHFSGKA